MVTAIITTTITAPAGGSFPGVTATGSGVTAPGDSDWSVTDGEAVDGNQLVLTPLNDPTPEADYQVEYWEVAVEQDGAAEAEIVRLPYGPWTSFARYIKTASATTAQRVRIRNVQSLKNTVIIDNVYLPSVGETCAQASTGASGDVLFRDGLTVILENVSGEFEPGAVTFDGTPGAIDGPSFPATSVPGYAVELRSEWSNPVTITPSTGAATASISANKTSCLQGEAVLLKGSGVGFDLHAYDIPNPLHAIHWKWSVAKAGEAGSHTAIGNSYFESDYGVARNDRRSGFSKVWGFAPITTGTVDVDLTARDRSGNSDVATQTLTVTAPTTYFSDAEIYAVSASQIIPAGTSLSTGDIYTDLDTAIADIPATGKALILLDTTGSHGVTAEASATFNGKAADELVIMPYSASGVGVDAGARVEIDYRLDGDSDHVVIYGINSTGPFDQSDPYTNGNANDGFGFANASNLSMSSCKIKGWTRDILTPVQYVLVDVETTDYLDYALQQGDPTDHAVVGCYLYHNPLAWHGDNNTKGESSAPFFTDHTNYRASRPDGDRGFSQCVLFSTAGWSGTLGQLPARLYGGGQYFPFDTHFSECIFESRNVELSVSLSASGGSLNYNNPKNIVFDKCRLIIGGQCANAISTRLAPLTIRNCISIWPDKAGTRGGSGAAAFVGISENEGAGGQFSQGDLPNQKIVVENNTAVSLVSPALANTAGTFELITYDSGIFPNVIERNNILHAPNLSTPITVTNLDATTQYTPLCIGSRYWDSTMGGTADGGTTDAERLAWNEANSENTAEKTEPSQTASFQPSSGSSAYQSATGSIPYDDFLSRVRPSGTQSKGSHDPGGT